MTTISTWSLWFSRSISLLTLHNVRLFTSITKSVPNRLSDWTIFNHWYYSQFHWLLKLSWTIPVSRLRVYSCRITFTVSTASAFNILTKLFYQKTKAIMPLLIRDYTWEETEKMMFITVPLKGVRANKVDLLSSEEFIKVWFD